MSLWLAKGLHSALESEVSHPLQELELTPGLAACFNNRHSRSKEGCENQQLLDAYDIPTGIYNNSAEYSIGVGRQQCYIPLAIAAIIGTSCTIQNIGSASLQRDAKFAKEVLEVIGYNKVVQTPTETTMQGPPIGQLKGLERLGFLGIANQRVKEYNRIQAMIDELAKFGIETNELDDGWP
ncbi:hypothetical protein BJ912DRAFT_1064406 [Pholiota molesta]|nr:hypothetical protein BJ912DRAFT_1064406 [Pholiota molesta]